jgi:chorismate-pyruvate lyase
LKRKRLDNSNLSSLHKALLKTEAELGCTIPPLLLIVIMQNGILESILQLLVRNDIEVIVLRQSTFGSVIRRKICVRRKIGGELVMHAESRIKTKNLPISLLEGIVKGEMGIGSLIENLRVETFRNIKDIGFDRSQRAIYRIYDVYIRKQRAITIKEYFPIDIPPWNIGWNKTALKME